MLADEASSETFRHVCMLNVGLLRSRDVIIWQAPIIPYMRRQPYQARIPATHT
jgi:hypothetical protein